MSVHAIMLETPSDHEPVGPTQPRGTSPETLAHAWGWIAGPPYRLTTCRHLTEIFGFANAETLRLIDSLTTGAGYG
jgi:hypothetical protein